jgi:hypothetical protein
MNDSNKAFVRHTINELLFPIFQDNIERENIVDNLCGEVVSDINKTADCNNFTSEDVRIALSRALMNKTNLIKKNMDKAVIKEKIARTSYKLQKARAEAENELVEIVKEAGGLITLLPTDGNFDDAIRVVKCYGDRVEDCEEVNVYALRVNEDNELTLCTQDTLKNYEFDNEVSFFFDGEEEDEALFEDMFSKPEYFEDFNGDFLKSYSLTNLLLLIGLYI